MKAFSVLNSFLRASAGNVNDVSQDQNGESQSESGGSVLLAPSLEQVISAPYNFNFS